MSNRLGIEEIRDRLVVKAVRNTRRMDQKEDGDASMYRPGIKLDLERSRLMTKSYKETEGESMPIRRAKALAEILMEMSLYIQDWEIIVGNNVSSPQGLYFGIDMNWRSVRRIVEGKEGQSLLDDEGRKELADMIEYWNGKSMSDIQQRAFSGDILKYWNMKEGSPAIWTHWSELGIPNYEKIFEIGLRGYLDRVAGRLEEIDRTVPLDYIDQKEFLQAVQIALEAVISLAHRYAAEAREKAARAETPEDRDRLLAIASRCERVPEHPPRTFAEALQSFFLIHIVRYIEYSTLGIGVRFDKVFGPYLEADLRDGRITREEALEMLQLLWVKFHELGLVYSPTVSSVYGGVASLQAITLGGTDENGLDVTNEVTYLVLETAKGLRSLEPSICLRYHDGTPDELLAKALDVVATGIGYPSFINDRAMVPALESWNVSPEDARSYAVSGCVYIEIPGKNVARRVYGAIALPGALAYALNQGKHPVTGKQVGAPTPDPLTFKSADDVMEAYLEQVRFFVERTVKIENTSMSLYEKYLPRPFYSAVLDGCIETGMDSRKWGYLSRVSDFFVTLGPTNVSDSIAAIKKIVFDDKRVAMQELLQALKDNWEGHDRIRQLMLTAPKYGNDDEYADSLAAEVQHRTADVMGEFTNRFGVPCRGDGSGISANYALGAIVPATPDGRFAGQAFADSTLAPTLGADRSGPTAVLKSASRIDTSKTFLHLLNQKFHPSALEGDKKKIFIQYLRAWGELNISQIQFNIVDKETLIEAQEEPDKHPDLLVRVAGYSAYFVDLSKGLQDSVIERTEQRL